MHLADYTHSNAITLYKTYIATAAIYITIISQKAIHCERPSFTRQKTTFCTAKEHLLQRLKSSPRK